MIEVGLVVAGRQLPLHQVPERELEVLARTAGQLRQIQVRHRRLAGVDAAAAVEDLERDAAHVLLVVEVVLWSTNRYSPFPSS